MTTSASTWEQADKAYQAHHINCPQCIAAGINLSSQVRCPIGQPLWDTYCAAGDPPHFTWIRPAPASRRPINKNQPAQQAGFFTQAPVHGRTA